MVRQIEMWREEFVMRFSRRQFFRTASGALAFGSTAAVLNKAGLAAAEPIKVANILDKTGGLNIYCLKQIKAAAMAVDEMNAAGGLLGRPIQLIFYDSQSNNQLNSQYATQAMVRDKVDVLHGGVTSSSREVMRPIVDKFKGLYFYNSLYEGGVCDRRHVCTGMVPAQQVEPLVDYIDQREGGQEGLHTGGRLQLRPDHQQVDAEVHSQRKAGQDLAVEFFPLDVTNFAPVLSRIQAAKPDVVWSALVGDAHMSFYRQFESTIGKKNMMLASGTYGVGRENATLSPQENEGIVIATSFIDTLPTDSAKAFVEKFKKYSGENEYVGEYGEYGYRGMMLWAEAVKKAGSPMPDDVIEALGRNQVQRGGRALHDRRPDQSHVMDIHIGVGNTSGSFDVVKSFSQRQPSDTQAVCDLTRTRTIPNSTSRQL